MQELGPIFFYSKLLSLQKWEYKCLRDMIIVTYSSYLILSGFSLNEKPQSKL
jgi:hypothetical protein